MYSGLQIGVEGSNVREVIDNFDSLHAGFKKRICEEEGNIRSAVNVYLNSENIRFMEGLDTPVKDGDEISIVPATVRPVALPISTTTRAVVL